jgi:hypothetical protein
MFRVNPSAAVFGFLTVLVLAVGGLSGCRKSSHLVSICLVQGPAQRSPLLGREVAVRGVVTAVFQDQEAEGFFVQDHTCPGGRSGSRGLLVLHERWIVLARPGDTVEISGLVGEQGGMTALSVRPDQVRVIEEAVDLPAARTVPGRGSALQQGFSWEDLEGELVQLNTIEVSDLKLVKETFWRGQARVIGGNSLDVLLPAVLSDRSKSADRIPGNLVLTRVTGVIWEHADGYALVGLLPPELPVVNLEVDGDPARKGVRFELLRDPASKPRYPFVPALFTRPLRTELTPELQPEATAGPAFVPADLLISEFYPDPPGQEPEGEWIEIFNPESYAVPLYPYKIGDAASSSGREGMVRFPEGSLIKPKEVVVVAGDALSFYRRYGFFPDFTFGEAAGSARSMEPYPDWAGSRVQLSNAGDEILILDGEDRIVDQAAYGGSALQDFTDPPRPPGQGNSLERYPPKRDTNSGQDWRERVEPSPGKLDRSPPTPTPGTPQPTPTGTAPGPSATPVPGFPRLSEVMADPPGPEPDGEWIEIFNPYSYAYPLAGFTVRDALSDSSREGWFVFPDGAFIPPRDVVIIANHPDTFLDTYGISPDFGLDPPSGWEPGDRRGSLRLRNAGDEIYLVDREGVLVDGMSYGDSAETRFLLPAERVPEGWSYARSLADSPEDPDPGWLGVSEISPGEISTRDATPTPTPTPTQTTTPTPTRILTASPTLTHTLAVPSATPTPRGTGAARTPTIPITLTPSPDSAGLKISEVMSDPSGPDPGGEWVEIINLASVGINLTGYRLGDHTGQGREGMKVFPPGSWMEPKGILVIANRGEDFLDRHGFLPDYEIMDTLPGVPDLEDPLEGPAGGVAFRNSGDEIRRGGQPGVWRF